MTILKNNTTAPDEKENMKTLVSVTNSLAKDGYETQFKATVDGLLSLKTQKTFRPDQVKIVHFYRFEGESDPSDSTILYLIEANDGLVGYSIDAYGVYSNHEDDGYDEFIREIKVEERDESLIF